MVSSNTTVDFIDFPYRHVAVSPHQQTLRLAQNLANGGAIDFYLIGRLDNHEDRSGFAPVKEIFHYHALHEAQYVDLRSRADVLLLKASEHEGEYRGWFRVLAENHFLFDVVRLDAATHVPWDGYRVVIIPEIEAISDALAQRIDRFVHDGGTAVVVGRSGFRDAAHEARPAPALACSGIEAVLQIREDVTSSYLKFEDKTGFARFAATDLVYLHSPYIYARYAPEAQGYMRLVPPHNFGPPERCYYTQVTDHPGFVVHPFGSGQAIYLPWSPGALFHRQGHVNTADFCADLLQGIVGLEPIGGDLSPMVEVTLFERVDGSHRLLHLVNGSGHFGNTFYPPVPMTDVEVTLRQATMPVAVRALRADLSLPFAWEAGKLTVRLPRLELFEALRIDAVT